jgi:hypothetical protein
LVVYSLIESYEPGKLSAYLKSRFGTLERLIFKVRANQLYLNDRLRWFCPEVVDSKCSACTSGEVENLHHFLCECPALTPIREQQLVQSLMEDGWWYAQAEESNLWDKIVSLLKGVATVSSHICGNCPSHLKFFQ